MVITTCLWCPQLAVSASASENSLHSDKALVSFFVALTVSCNKTEFTNCPDVGTWAIAIKKVSEARNMKLNPYCTERMWAQNCTSAVDKVKPVSQSVHCDGFLVLQIWHLHGLYRCLSLCSTLKLL